jgi:hypothetical protein
VHHREKLPAEYWILPKAAEHTAGDEVRAWLVDAASHHAVMFRPNHHGDAQRFQDLVDSSGDLRGKALLNLEPLRISFDDACKFRDPNDPFVWHIGYPGPPDDRSDVVLAMAFERDAPQHDHLIVPAGFLEGFLQYSLSVVLITGKIFPECTNLTLWGFA